MIPYFQYSHFSLGPVVIQVWGLLVAFGIMAAVLVMAHLAKKYVLSPEVAVDMSIWILMAAFVGARFFHVVFYEPMYYVTHPLDVVKVWQGGLSSLGGFAGALFGVWLFAKKRRFSWAEMVPYFDIATVSLWLGWGIGRLGCFLIHDHPGTLTSFFGGVQYPGGARFDLGLMESALGFVLFLVFYASFSRLVKKSWGLAAVCSAALYATARFFLDFLRATDVPLSDVRYWALTPAQLGMVGVLFGLTICLIYGKVKRLKKS